MKYIIVIAILYIELFGSISGYETRFNAEQVTRDVNAQNMSKYKNDNFEVISAKSLVERGIVKDENDTFINLEFETINDFYLNLNCNTKIDLTKWSATVYDIKYESGIVSCMVAPVQDLNNPIGLFEINYPSAKKLFTKDYEEAKIEMATELADAHNQFDEIYLNIKTKQDEYKQQFDANHDFLTVPELFTSVILTDVNIVDVPATRDTGVLQFNPAITVSDDAKNIALNDAETIFNVYAGLSDISMEFFIVFLSFFGLFGLAKNFVPTLTDWMEGKKNYDKKIPYSFGIIVGLLLFIPTADFDGLDITSENGKEIAEYDIMSTQFQEFERSGYAIFSDWANKATGIIIDAEMQSIINKSGVGTAEQILNAYTGKELYKKLYLLSNSLNNAITSGYDIESMSLTTDATKFRYSDNASTVFPTSEAYGYAMALYDGSGEIYYRDLPKDNFYNNEVLSAYANMTNKSEEIGTYYYPIFSLSFAGKNYFLQKFYKQRYESYKNTLDSLVGHNNMDTQKITAISKLVESQYSLYNNWGYLSVLALPIVKMQTEMIGGLYNNPQKETLEKLDKKIADIGGAGGEISKSIISKIPYMFVPGSGTVFNITNSLPGGSFTKIGGIGLSYYTAKSVLELAPILSILAFGILRFVIILLKIFGLHFSALFLLPIAFVKNNISVMSKFSMKVFSTMLEIPLFVIGIWLAVVANSIVHSIGDILSKKMTLAMVNNNEAMRATLNTGNWFDSLSDFFANVENTTSVWKLYLFDGFLEVAISAFSIVIIYKIVVSFHNSLFEAIELKGVESIDNMVDSIKSEAITKGAKI